MHSEKKLLLINCFLLCIYMLSGASVKLKIDSDKGVFPTVRSKEILLEITGEPFVAEDPYLLSSNSKNEIQMFDIYDSAKAFFLLSPLTDMQISGESSNIIDSNFGRFRCISGNGNSFIIHGKNGVTITIAPNSDIVYSCVSDLNQMYNTNIAVFSGEAKVYKGKKSGNFDTQNFIATIMPMQIAEIENPKIINITDISPESLKYFQKTNSKRRKNAMNGIRPVLETLTLRNKVADSSDEIIFDIDEIDDSSDDIIKMPPRETRVITDFTKFRLSYIFQQNKMGGSIGYHPSIKTKDNLFEFSLRFDLPFLIEFSDDFIVKPINPERIWDNFLQINNRKSEWFVDSVLEPYSEKPEMIALRIMEDLLLKIDKLRWGNENTPFSFMLGTSETKTDKNALRYFYYSPSFFLPVYRATSIDFAYRNKYVTAQFFAENVPFGGLLDNSVQISTPVKSMKSRVEIDFAIDTYRLMQTKSNAALPLYADIGWSFTVFELERFGYEFYLNAGLVFPLVADDNDIFSMKPQDIKNMIHFTFGQKLRGGKSPMFSIELFLKPTNMHHYTPLYFLFKDEYLTKLGQNSGNSDYDIGGRFGLSWQPISWINYYAFYRPAVSIANMFGEEGSSPTPSYSDNLLMGLSVTPPKQDTEISGSLAFALEWDKPVNAIEKSATDGKPEFLCENLGMHVSTQIHFEDMVTLGVDFSVIPSSDSVKFNGEVFVTTSFKNISKSVKRHSDISEKRMRELNKIISRQNENYDNDEIDGEEHEN